MESSIQIILTLNEEEAEALKKLLGKIKPKTKEELGLNMKQKDDTSRIFDELSKYLDKEWSYVVGSFEIHFQWFLDLAGDSGSG